MKRNILSKVKKSSKIVQEQKTLILALRNFLLLLLNFFPERQTGHQNLCSSNFEIFQMCSNFLRSSAVWHFMRQHIYSVFLYEISSTALLDFWKVLLCYINHCRYCSLRKMSVFGVILVHIFPHSNWIRGDTECLSVFSPNAGKYGPE